MFFSFGPHGLFILNLQFIVDLFMSFLCAFLSYGYFDSYYVRLCGVCESRCFVKCDQWMKEAKLELVAVTPDV